MFTNSTAICYKLVCFFLLISISNNHLLVSDGSGRNNTTDIIENAGKYPI